MPVAEAFRRVIAELKVRENKSVDAGKGVMAAYYADMLDALQGAYNRREGAAEDGSDPNPPVERAMRRLLDPFYADQAVNDGYCYAHGRMSLAYTRALPVYATRILRLAGHVVPNVSLDELRARKRWPDVAA